MNPGEPLTASASATADERVETDPFVADIARLLMTFFIVVAVDLVIVSLLTHKLRFWFPLWLDPHWAVRPDPWVVYSQSYFAGIFLIPFLCRIVDRDFLARASAGARAAFWSVCAVAFGFVLWWKGSLMLEYMQEVVKTGRPCMHSMWMFQKNSIRVTRLMMPVKSRADGPVDQILAVLYPDRA